MSDRSTIEWTDATWNPTRGCSRVSPGCANCYAERVAYRFSGPGKAYEGLAKMTKAGPRWTGDLRAPVEKLFEPNHWKRPRRIFVNSQSDLFHEKLSYRVIDDVFAVMAMNGRHTFQVLTKRVDRMHEWFFLVRDGLETARRVGLRALDFTCQMVAGNEYPKHMAGGGQIDRDGSALPWPLANVWIGVSVENQHYANARIPLLIDTPAAVRFLSCEPLLGPIDDREADPATWTLDLLDWVIAGGESGPGARPMHPDWARGLRDQCASAGVPFFFKQWGEWRYDFLDPTHCVDRGGDMYFELGKAPGRPLDESGLVARVGKKAAGRLLDGREHNEFPHAVNA